jgi:hypothetical protein
MGLKLGGASTGKSHAASTKAKSARAAREFYRLIVLLLFLGSGTTSPPMPSAEGGPPTLIVEVVDPVLILLPDSRVTVKPASGKGPSKSAHADDNGYARFWVETVVAYTIEAKTQGFNKTTLKHVLHRKTETVFANRARTFNYK